MPWAIEAACLDSRLPCCRLPKAGKDIAAVHIYGPMQMTSPFILQSNPPPVPPFVELVTRGAVVIELGDAAQLIELGPKGTFQEMIRTASWTSTCGTYSGCVYTCLRAEKPTVGGVTDPLGVGCRAAVVLEGWSGDGLEPMAFVRRRGAHPHNHQLNILETRNFARPLAFTEYVQALTVTGTMFPRAMRACASDFAWATDRSELDDAAALRAGLEPAWQRPSAAIALRPRDTPMVTAAVGAAYGRGKFGVVPEEDKVRLGRKRAREYDN